MKTFSLVIALLGLSNFAIASTCETPSINGLAQQSTHIYIGEVIARKSLDKNGNEICGPKIATFKIHQALKGPNTEIVDIYSGDACDWLGNYFSLGNNYLIYAKKSENDSYLIDLESCTTDLLSNSIADRKLQKTAKKTKTTLDLSLEELIGTWVSYDASTDKPYEDITSVTLEFNKNYRFKAKTIDIHNKTTKYIGYYYVLGNQLGILDEDGDQLYYYKISNADPDKDRHLEIVSKDKAYSYTLKKR